MIIPRTVVRLIAVTSLMLMFSFSCRADESLETKINQSGWDKIIGTWVDAETKGEGTRTSFAWKYPGHLIENITANPGKETISIFGVNQKTGKVFVSSGDSLGGSSQGEVSFEKGLATFQISYADHQGNAGDLKIEYRLVDEDSLDVTFVMGKPITIKLVREKKAD